MSSIVATIAPVFGLIMLGLVAGRSGYISAGADKAIVEFVFRIAIPALLFRMLATAPEPAGDPLALYAAFFAPIAIVWLVTTLVAVLVLRVPVGDSAPLALSAVFGNLVLLGLPVVLKALGPEAATPVAIIFLLEFAVMWLAATLHLMLTAPSAGVGLGGTIRAAIIDLATNPILIALAAGALWRLTDLGLAAIPDRIAELLGRASAPASLFALGLALARLELKGQAAVVALIVVMKLIAMPALAWWAAFEAFALPKLWAAVVVLFAAMPTGAIPFLFASRYGRSVDTVSATIAVAVPLSAITLSVVLYLLATVGGVPLKPG